MTRVGDTLLYIATKHFLSKFTFFSSQSCPKMVRLARLIVRLRYSGSLDPSRNSGKTNTYFFNIFAFWPHQPPTYTHHNCHLISSGLIFFSITYVLLHNIPELVSCLPEKESKPRSLESSRPRVASARICDFPKCSWILVDVHRFS